MCVVWGTGDPRKISLLLEVSCALELDDPSGCPEEDANEHNRFTGDSPHIHCHQPAAAEHLKACHTACCMSLHVHAACSRLHTGAGKSLPTAATAVSEWRKDSLLQHARGLHGGTLAVAEVGWRREPGQGNKLAHTHSCWQGATRHWPSGGN